MRTAALLVLLLTVIPCQGEERLRIAVASNFRATLAKVNTAFEQDSGIPISLSSASTGVLATQIRHGAPFDLFFAADRQTPQSLRDDAVGTTSECYAVGRLVLTGGNGSLEQLADQELSLAIANPDTAPYGRAARQVLEREAFAAGKGRKLVRGNNVVQAYQFWHSGSVDLALLAASIAPDTATAVPTTWHAPIEQHLLVVKPSNRTEKYLKWLRSDRVRSVISSAGYDPCP